MIYKLNEINLIPDSILYRGRRTANLVLRVFLIAVAAAALIGAMSIRTLQRMDMEKKVRQVEMSLNNKGLAELDQAEIQYAQKQEEIKKLDELTGAVSQTNLKVSELLQKVSDLMPASVVTESIIYNGASVTLSIKSNTRQDIALYLKKLHDDSNFVNVNISEISGRDKAFRCTIMLDISAIKEVK